MYAESHGNVKISVALRLALDEVTAPKAEVPAPKSTGFDADKAQKRLEEAWLAGGSIVVRRLIKLHWAEIYKWMVSERLIGG